MITGHALPAQHVLHEEIKSFPIFRGRLY